MALSRIAGLALAMAALLSAGPTASATATGESALPPDPVCPAPISVCQSGPIPLDPTSPSIVPVPAECPHDYRCTCVPSCPSCDDCAAEVCVLGPSPECKTACDCQPGLGCFDGRCLAGFAPVYCCDAGLCPLGQQCQYRDGTMSRCDHYCSGEIRLCGDDTNTCGDGRICACSASCPTCEDCGARVCVAPDAPTPYRCDNDHSCANPADRCVCASSCNGCDDCVLELCVPGECSDPMCEERVRKITQRIRRLIRHARRCDDSAQCVLVDTSTRCIGSCGAFVNGLYQKPVRRMIRRLDRRVCSTFVEDGCQFMTPGCIEQHGECIRGHCVAVAGAG